MEPNVSSYKDTPLNRLVDTTDDGLQQIMLGIAYGKNGMSPTEYLASVVLKDTFTRSMDDQDRDTWRLIDDDEQPKTVINAHRGDGKTSRICAKILRSIVLRLDPFIMYVQATHDDAAFQTENVKAEMLGNPFIREVFGNMKATTFDDISKDFSKKAWFACNPPKKGNRASGQPFCFVLPRGAQQRVRGRNIFIGGRRVRPTNILIDDLEDDEDVLNETNRRKLERWYFGALLRCVRQDAFPDPETHRWKRPKDASYDWVPPWRIFHVDTLKHQDSLLRKLMGSTDWKHVKNPLGIATADADGNVTYQSRRPHLISDAQLTAEAISAKANAVLDVFYREVLCEPTAKEYACWTMDMFQYYALDREKELQNDPRIVRFLVVDPSKTAAQHSDFTGIIAVAVDPHKGYIYVRKIVNERLTTSQIPERALNVAVATNSRLIAVERIGAEGYVDTNFINAANERGIQPGFIWLGRGHTPPGDYGTGNDAVKAWRAQQILPYYQQKEVLHHPELKDSPLETYMLEYDRPSDWGLLDCMGYIPAVMNELGLQFGKQTERYGNVVNFETKWTDRRMERDIESRKWAYI